MLSLRLLASISMLLLGSVTQCRPTKAAGGRRRRRLRRWRRGAQARSPHEREEKSSVMLVVDTHPVNTSLCFHLPAFQLAGFMGALLLCFASWKCFSFFTSPKLFLLSRSVRSAPRPLNRVVGLLFDASQRLPIYSCSCFSYLCLFSFLALWWSPQPQPLSTVANSLFAERHYKRAGR